MRLVLIGVASVIGLAATVAAMFTAFGEWSTVAVCITVLYVGPAWAATFAAVSDDHDFAGATRSRQEWLRLIPWTFALAPLVVPNLVILAAFMRDARADGGRSPLTWDRMRPGDGYQSHHWPG